ncbi:UDP-glucosyltransferase 2-like [Anopheles ziemanni]|uniref:UDP-glucosyltransferase 2-like n=1 Tax=Anopheles coustani TaxID=139045 RepID=UPI0026580D2F|nr:UDP-glucosyltransferase 2-like [Anopheles coustani]XP_058177092.1 UDP-glucosyltransferase 2-like [Anopheles ziemanni]
MWCKRVNICGLVALVVALTMPILADGARILAIFPSPARSHQIVYQAYVRGLIDRGHQLTVMTTDPFATDHPNVTVIDWSYSYRIVNENFDVVDMKQRNMNFYQIATRLRTLTKLFLEAQLAHPDVQALIHSRDEHFDVVIVEYYQFTPMYAFAELFNAPMIGITSIDSMGTCHEAMGNVMNVVAHPEMNHKFTRDLTFLQRVEAVVSNLVIKYHIMPTDFVTFDRMIEQNFGSNMSRSADLIRRVDFLLVNAEPSIGYVRPMLPNSVQIGFMHIHPPKSLPADLKAYLDRSEHGVVYFSLGTLIRSDSLNQRNLNLFLEVFKSLKYDVLWKHDADLDLNGTTNIRMERWLPQQDLLAHPNVKVFVMQGGQQSMEEAIDRHVPLVVIPFNFDQFGNADKVVERGIGRSVWMERLTEESLREAILEVARNKRYKRNIARLGRLVRDQPMRPVEKAVWWTEYVIRHGGVDHFHYPAARMPFLQYHYYDVAGAGLLLLAVLLGALYFVLKRIVRFLLQKKINKQTNATTIVND